MRYLIVVLLLVGLCECGYADEEGDVVNPVKVIGDKIVISYEEAGLKKVERITISDLVSAIKKANNLAIGEYYHKIYSWGQSGWGWGDFTKKDVKDMVDGFTKIKYSWIPNSCIIFYNDNKEKKEKIEKIAQKEYEKVK